jgi:hypothetical protein
MILKSGNGVAAFFLRKSVQIFLEGLFLRTGELLCVAADQYEILNFSDMNVRVTSR